MSDFTPEQRLSLERLVAATVRDEMDKRRYRRLDAVISFVRGALACLKQKHPR